MNMSLAAEKMLRKEGYILEALDRHCLNGDVYVSEEALFGICKKGKPDLNYEVFSSDLAELFRQRRALIPQEQIRHLMTGLCVPRLAEALMLAAEIPATARPIRRAAA